VRSCFKKLYGSAGDEVVLISDRNNVLIIENGKGEKFPCNRDHFIPDEKPVATEMKPVIKKAPAKKKSASAGPSIQTSIF